ncbi:hypothetical protein SDC9_118236 [bioreactor metagenome]|uniref:Uncharacterized protein n=1 Tax=bioreactor metagenome TaxID=1076179 RepID=A0A645C0Y4_9ZZZZ
MLHGKHFFADLHVRLGEEFLDFAPDHRFDQLRRGNFGYGIGTDIVRVAEDRHAGREAIHVLQAVRDENNRFSVVTQFFADAVEFFRFAARQRRRRFVHDDDARVHREGFCNLDHLLLRNGQGAHQRLRRKLRIQAFEQCVRALVHLFPLDHAALDGLVTHKDIFRNAQVRIARHVLIDRGNARALRVQRGFELHLFAVEEHRAVLGMMNARDNLDKRRLARAVFAHQRVNLARLELKIHAVQRFHARENLRDVA